MPSGDPPGSELFHCKKFACDLPVRTCIARQEKRVKACGQLVRPLQWQCCDPERCRQGAGIRRRLERRGLLDLILYWIGARKASKPREEKLMDLARRKWKQKDQATRLEPT